MNEEKLKAFLIQAGLLEGTQVDIPASSKPTAGILPAGTKTLDDFLEVVGAIAPAPSSVMGITPQIGITTESGEVVPEGSGTRLEEEVLLAAINEEETKRRYMPGRRIIPLVDDYRRLRDLYALDFALGDHEYERPTRLNLS
jgi:hypothetical protein